MVTEKEKFNFVKSKVNLKVLRKISNRLRFNEWKTPENIKLIKRARRDLGYSTGTRDLDIINSLFKASKAAQWK